MEPNQVVTSLEPLSSLSQTTQGSVAPQTIQLSLVVLPLITFFAVFGLALYLRNQKKLNKKAFSKALQLGFVLGAIPIALVLALGQTNFVSRAEYNPTPRNIEIKNVDDNSFTLSWRTGTAVVSGYQASDQPSFETIVQSQTQVDPNRAHEYTVTNLQPETTYYVQILSDKSWYGSNGRPLEITTTSL